MALVQLKIFVDTGEARVVRAMLEAHGIPAFLFDEHSGFNMIPYGGLLRIRLMVSETDAEAAARLIADSPGIAGDEVEETE